MSEVCIEFVIYRGDDEEEEIVLEVRGNAEPYVPANFSGHPDNWSPPEGGCSDVEGVFLNGQLWGGTLTKKENELAQEMLTNQLIANIESAAEDAAEARAEAMMDDYYDDYCDDDRCDYMYDPY